MASTAANTTTPSASTTRGPALGSSTWSSKCKAVTQVDATVFDTGIKANMASLARQLTSCDIYVVRPQESTVLVAHDVTALIMALIVCLTYNQFQLTGFLL